MTTLVEVPADWHSPALALSASADAYNATQRLYGVFEAETLTETTVQDEELEDAVQIVNAEFVWDGPPPDAPTGKDKKSKKQDEKTVPPPSVAEAKHEETFKLKGVHLSIPQGQLTAIVGKCPRVPAQPARMEADFSAYRPCWFWEVVVAPGHDRRDAPHCRVCSVQGYGRILPAECLDPKCYRARQHYVRTAVRRGAILESDP